MIMVGSVDDGDDDVIHVYVYLNDIHLLIWISLNGHHFVILSLSIISPKFFIQDDGILHGTFLVYGQ